MESTPPGNGPLSADAEAALALTTVLHCATLNEAQMALSLLTSFGITAIIDSENYFRMFGGMMPGLGRIRLQVRQLDAEAAAEILSEGPVNAAGEEVP